MNSTNSPTPRTDSFCIELEPTDFDCNCWSQVVAIANFARQLERELEQAKRDNGIIITAFALRNSELKEKAEEEIARLREENAELKQGKVFVDPKWIYDLETQLAKAHEELCQAGLREYGN